MKKLTGQYAGYPLSFRTFIFRITYWNVHAAVSGIDEQTVSVQIGEKCNIKAQKQEESNQYYYIGKRKKSQEIKFFENRAKCC